MSGVDSAVRAALYETHGALTHKLFDGTMLSAKDHRRLARVRSILSRLQCEELIGVRYRAAYMRKGRAQRIALRKLAAAEERLFQRMSKR